MQEYKFTHKSNKFWAEYYEITITNDRKQGWFALIKYWECASRCMSIGKTIIKSRWFETFLYRLVRYLMGTNDVTSFYNRPDEILWTLQIFMYFKIKPFYVFREVDKCKRKLSII